MKQPTKIDGWRGAGGTLHESIFDARKSIAKEELLLIMSSIREGLGIEDRIEDEDLLNELEKRWDRLEELMFAFTTGFNPDSRDEE